MRHGRLWLLLSSAVLLCAYSGCSSDADSSRATSDHRAPATRTTQSALITNQLTKLTAFDGANKDRFATSVDIDGDTAVVGSVNWNAHSVRENREVA
ncbi:MAG: hypothetical protein ABEN55_07070, partial [Bradymonadaceae bacterium]